MNQTEVSTAIKALERYNNELKAYSVSQTILRLGEEWEHQVGLLQVKRQIYKVKEEEIKQLEHRILEQEKVISQLQKEGLEIKSDLKQMQIKRPEIEEDLGRISDDLHHIELKMSRLNDLKLQMDTQSKENSEGRAKTEESGRSYNRRTYAMGTKARASPCRTC